MTTNAAHTASSLTLRQIRMFRDTALDGYADCQLVDDCTEVIASLTGPGSWFDIPADDRREIERSRERIAAAMNERGWS